MAQPDISAQVIAIEQALSIDLTQLIYVGAQALTVGGSSIASGSVVALASQIDDSDGIYQVTYVIDALNNKVTNVTWAFKDFIAPHVMLFMMLRLNAGTLFDTFYDKFSEEFELIARPQVALYPVSHHYIVQRQDSTLTSYTEVNRIHVTIKAQSLGWMHRVKRFLLPEIHDLTSGNVELMETTPEKIESHESEDFIRVEDFEFELTSQMSRLDPPYALTTLNHYTVTGGIV